MAVKTGPIVRVRHSIFLYRLFEIFDEIFKITVTFGITGCFINTLSLEKLVNMELLNCVFGNPTREKMSNRASATV